MRASLRPVAHVSRAFVKVSFVVLPVVLGACTAELRLPDREEGAGGPVAPAAGRVEGGRILHVDDDGLAPAPGVVVDGSRLRPFTNLQAAVNVASSGDTLRVADGVYVGNVHVDGKVLKLQGGYRGGDAAAYRAGRPGDFDARDVAGHRAILSGAGNDAVVTLKDAGESLLEGFTVTGGSGHWDGDRSEGGGIYAEGGAPTLRDNIIEQNDARHGKDLARGGGVALADADAVVINNVIRHNVATRGAGVSSAGGRHVVLDGNLVEGNISVGDHGGGLFLSGPDVRMRNNVVLGNEVGRVLRFGWGGGVYAHTKGTHLTMTGDVVRGNFAPGLGSGIFIDNEADALIRNARVFANECPERGGAALYVDGGEEEGTGSTVVVESSTLADNRCPRAEGGNGVYVEGWSKVTVKNSIVWGNAGKDFFVDPSSSLTVTFTLSEEPFSGAGNLSEDPLFADPEAGDYHLRSVGGRFEPRSASWVVDTRTSPAVDRAEGTTPFDAEPIPNGGRADLGAYGNTAEASRSPR